MRHRYNLIGVVMIGLLFGCGGDKKSARREAGDADPPAGAALAQQAKAMERKIIYEATVSLVVAEVDAAAEQVRATAKQFDAYISASDVSGSAGTRRSASFTLRVPAEKFETLRDALAKLGEVTRNSSKSEDVTEEFYDLDARIKVLKQEEEALKELLKKEAGKLDELLKVREQLTRNREQIEKAEGRQRYLSAKVTYSTITVQLSETKDYVPPTSPSYGSRLSRTFWNSVGALEDAGKAVVTFLVAIAPWSPFILLGLWLLRRAVRRSRLAEAVTGSPPVGTPAPGP